MILIDNISHRLSTDLKETIAKGNKLSIAASTFSIYAFEALKKEFKGISELRFIFTSPLFLEQKEEKKKKTGESYIQKQNNICGTEFEIRLRNQLMQRSIAKECSVWIREKVVFKSNKHPNNPLNSLIHVSRENEEFSYTNFNGFTSTDLGETHRKGFPTLIQKNSYPETTAYLNWFKQIWENKEDLEDVTKNVLDYLEIIIQDHSPEFIYFLTIFNLFQDFLEEIMGDSLPNEQLGFKNTTVWNKLYNFQKDAVIGAINKLEKYNGCILADSVGLGKTFTALGVMKYYELRNKDVLVLCPKKLEANWNTFRYNDKNNILSADRFRYDVLFHTDLSRERGMSNGRNLETVNWGNYGLLVIDESHNFRNNNTIEGKENRYQRLLRKIVKEGIETKVLMLSATPVNNRFNDLRNQLALAYEGNSSKIDDKLNTEKGIELVFRKAQQAFNIWSKYDTEERTTENLLQMLDFDFFEILDSLTIARSRKHITTYYDTSEIGKFPERNKPISIQSPLSSGSSISYGVIAEKLALLNLSIYTPLNYILPGKQQKYSQVYDKVVKTGKFTQVDREKSLQILMRINLLKRIESSIDSFRITLNGIIKKIKAAMDKLSNAEELESGESNSEIENENFDWDSNWGDQENIFGTTVKVHISDMDTRKWKGDLEEDLQILENLWKQVNTITSSKDIKLLKLIEILEQKIENPQNPDNKKAIVFTAFADTANYLYENLNSHFKKKYSLNSALITGSKKTTNAQAIPSDLNPILSCFSPLSKDKELIYPQIKAEIDLLIATDCISEGQNLQDCDTLINYDIHWNPVRIIQRFGRIDRIGSKNSKITMINFWPDVTLDSYINLKQKVESKMLISNMASTGDDNILNSEDQDLEYRKIQLKKLQEEVIDLEDLREGVSITDLGLNDFRVDLSNLLKRYSKKIDSPNGLYTVVPSTELNPSGIVFLLKDKSSVTTSHKHNRLHPFQLVYIKKSGEVHLKSTETKKILDSLRQLCIGEINVYGEICKEISQKTKDYKDMNEYSELLKSCIHFINQTEEEKDVQSLFRTGGTTALTDTLKGNSEYELITYFLVV